MQLASWQQAFVDYCNGESPQDDINELVNASNQHRLSVYLNNSRQVLMGALKQSFPVCCTVLGEEYFTFLARTYIDCHPARSNNLNNYGFDWHLFLYDATATRKELIGLEYLSDLARLEWLVQCCYYQADNRSFDITKVAALSEFEHTKITLVLQPSLFLFQSSHPVYEIWLRHQVRCTQMKVAEPSENYSMCVYRDGFKVKVKRVSKNLYELLLCFKNSESLADILEQGKNIQYLPEVIRNGWVSSFFLAESK